MKSYLKSLGMALVACLITLPALAQNVGAGKDGWGYDQRAEELVAQLDETWQVVNFSGSEDIARAVCNDDTVSIGIVQVDAMLQMEREGCSLLPIGIYPVQEYAFMMFPPDGANELDDFNENDHILIGEPGSGSTLFWRTIVSIENSEHGNKSSWSRAKGKPGAFTLAPTWASVGDIDAALLVTSADAEIIQDLLRQGWTIGELDDKDIDDFQFRRGNLYKRATITVDHPTRWRDVSQDAIEVRSYWVANSDWVNENPAELARITSIIAAIN